MKATNGHSGLNHSNILFLFLISLCLAFGIVLASCSDSSTADGPSANLRVGVLLDETGQAYPIGRIALSAIELAAEDFNRRLKENGHSKQIELFVEDTQGDPQIAAEKIQTFAWAGITPVFSGSSGEIEAVYDYARQNDHLLISGYSTAPSLAKEDGPLFRFCLTDIKQAKALVRWAEETNIESLVMVYRDDVYGNDLKTYVAEFAPEMGIAVEQEVSYSPDQTDFGDTVISIEQKVILEKAKYPAERVAVLLVALNEITDIFKSADGNAELESIRWIGAEGVEPDTTLFKATNTLRFAQKVGFSTCNFGMLLSGIKKPFEHVPDQLKEISGLEKIPITAYYYYDAMWVLAESWFSMAQMDADLLKKNICFKADILSVCSDDIGLDEFGDRKWGMYDYWVIDNEEFENVAIIVFGFWETVDGEFIWL